jgi:hypothetical protein
MGSYRIILIIVSVGLALWNVLFIMSMSRVGHRARGERVLSLVLVAYRFVVVALLSVAGILGGVYVEWFLDAAIIITGFFAVASYSTKRQARHTISRDH